MLILVESNHLTSTQQHLMHFRTIYQSHIIRPNCSIILHHIGTFIRIIGSRNNHITLLWLIVRKILNRHFYLCPFTKCLCTTPHSFCYLSCLNCRSTIIYIYQLTNIRLFIKVLSRSTSATFIFITISS